MIHGFEQQRTTGVALLFDHYQRSDGTTTLTMSAWELEAQKKRAAAIAFLEKNGESVSTGNKGNVLVKPTEIKTDNTLALLLNRKASTTKAEDDKRREQEAKLAVIKEQEDARRKKYVEDVAKTLPPNWETVVDNATKKCYYWNHITNETRWERPVVGEESSRSSSSSSNSSSSSGSASSSSSSSIPTAAAISIHNTTTTTKAELPADWEEKVHPATSQTYYIHKITGEKSFAFPGSELAMAAVNRPNSNSLQSMLGKRMASGPATSGPQMNNTNKSRHIDPRDPGGSKGDRGKIGTMADSTAGGPLWQQRPYPAPGTVLRAQPSGGGGSGHGGSSFHSGGRGSNYGSGGGGRGFGGRTGQGRGNTHSSSSGGGGQYGRAVKPAGVSGHYGP